MEQLLDWIPAFTGMTVHTKNRNLGSKEDSLNLAVMKSPPVYSSSTVVGTFSLL